MGAPSTQDIGARGPTAIGSSFLRPTRTSTLLWVLLRRLRFGAPVDAGTVLATAAAMSLYAEAQFAGWVAPPPELGARSAPASPAGAQSEDAEALLARFYSCQEC